MRVKAITSRGSCRFTFGEYNLTLGGSYRYADVGIILISSRFGGIFCGWNFRRFSYLGEMDVIADAGTQETGTSGLVASHLFRYRL